MAYSSSAALHGKSGIKRRKNNSVKHGISNNSNISINSAARSAAFKRQQ